MKLPDVISGLLSLKTVPSPLPTDACYIAHGDIIDSFPDGLNPVASAFPVACWGVSERMGNIIILMDRRFSAVYCGELQYREQGSAMLRKPAVIIHFSIVFQRAFLRDRLCGPFEKGDQKADLKKA
jgi:hypothetical protein